MENVAGKPRPKETRDQLSRRNRLAWEIDRDKQLSYAAKARENRRHVGLFSRLEQRALKLLVGIDHHVKVAGHIFDFGKDDLLVEINGCFWHYHTCRPNCWSDEAIRKRWKDWRFVTLAWQAGYRVLTLWECEEEQWGEKIYAAL